MKWECRHFTISLPLSIIWVKSEEYKGEKEIHMHNTENKFSFHGDGDG